MKWKAKAPHVLFIVAMIMTCTKFSMTLLNLIRNDDGSVPTQMFSQWPFSYCQWDRITLYNTKVNPNGMNTLLTKQIINTDGQTLSTSR
jgi:hypothetical protein